MDAWVCGYSGISIHTPIKGVTVGGLKLYAIYDDFNPHSHKGSDLMTEQPNCDDMDFNPHSHKGSDSAILSRRVKN